MTHTTRGFIAPPEVLSTNGKFLSSLAELKERRLACEWLKQKCSLATYATFRAFPSALELLHTSTKSIKLNHEAT